MKLLLDTHILLWSLLEPTLLSQQVASELENPSSEISISPISLWEILVLTEKGRLLLQPDALTWVRQHAKINSFKGSSKASHRTQNPLNHEVAIQSRSLDLPHQDPADPFLAATAIVYDLTLVTADDRLLGSKQFSLLANS